MRKIVIVSCFFMCTTFNALPILYSDETLIRSERTIDLDPHIDANGTHQNTETELKGEAAFQRERVEQLLQESKREDKRLEEKRLQNQRVEQSVQDKKLQEQRLERKRLDDARDRQRQTNKWIEERSLDRARENRRLDNKRWEESQRRR